MARAPKQTKQEPLEVVLRKTADKLRKNIDAAEYKHVVLGLIFLKYISDTFEAHYNLLVSGEGEFAGADPEDRDEYTAYNVFFVPENARWSYLLNQAKQPNIGKLVDEAMEAIENDNPQLKGVLPKVYARQNLDPTSLGELIDLIGNIALGDAKSRSADVLGHVFEYFLGEFALAEGKQGGQFYRLCCTNRRNRVVLIFRYLCNSHRFNCTKLSKFIQNIDSYLQVNHLTIKASTRYTLSKSFQGKHFSLYSGSSMITNISFPLLLTLVPTALYCMIPCFTNFIFCP